MKNQQKYLVAIRCITYNHEKYLVDALEGFVMQKTNFPFVAIVHDDASTDGTVDILRKYAEKYPDIIHPIYETENQYSKCDGSLGRIMNEAIAATGAKYVAICEGDDYWTDPYKLQKQVDFMEAHEGYGMICSPSNIYDQVSGTFREAKGCKGDEVFDKLFIGCSDLFTATILIRKNIYDKFVKDTVNLSLFNLDIDTALYYWFSLHSKIHYMDEPTAVYRVLQNSACHSTNPKTTLKMMQRYLDEKIAFLSYAKGISDEKFIFMMEEIRDFEQKTIEYAQYIKEMEVRQSKAYKIGKKITNIFGWIKRRLA